MFTDHNDVFSSQSNHLPPRVRSIDRLAVVNHDEDLGASPVPRKVVLVQKEVETKSSERRGVKRKGEAESVDRSVYYFKRHKPDSRLSELEAYCASICEFLATSDYVPSVHAYHDDNGQMAGVASKAILDFKSNHKNPLREQDTVIECDAIKIEQQCTILLNKVESLLVSLEQPSSVYTSVGLVRAMFLSFFDSTPTSYQVKRFLSSFLADSEPFSSLSLKALSTLVKAREKYIHKDSHVSPDPINELLALQAIKKTLFNIKKLNSGNGRPSFSVEVLEELDKMVKSKTINLNEVSGEMEAEIFGEAHCVNVRDLKNYRILKGLAVTLSTRFIFKEGDNNNSNMSKEGKIIDFDWTKAPILFEFREHDLFNMVFRCPNEQTFACTPHNIRHFPDVNTNLFYWPTKQAEIYKVIIEIVSQFLDHCGNLHVEDENDIYRRVARLVLFAADHLFKDSHTNQSVFAIVTDFSFRLILKFKALLSGRPEQQCLEEERIRHLFDEIKKQFIALTAEHEALISNLETRGFDFFGNEENTFTKADNDVYQSLSTHPVFIFHKYKTFLKYALTDVTLYQSLAGLNIIPNKPYLVDEYKEKYLDEALVNDESARLHEVRMSLSEIPDFKKFLEAHGEYAFSMIKEECLAYKEKFASKMTDKPYYATLVMSVDVDVMEKRFLDMSYQLGVIFKARDISSDDEVELEAKGPLYPVMF